MNKDMSLDSKRSYVSKYHLNEAFPDDILPLIELHIFDKGEYFCHSGERVEFFHIIVSGKCKVIPSSEMGKEVLLSYSDPLSFCGDIELFNECEALHSVCAVSKVTAIAIPRQMFFNEMMQIPAFLQLLCKSFAAKIYKSSQNHSSKLLYPINNRLSRILLSIAEEQNSDSIQIKMGETSQLLGISQRHLRRVISSYEKDGIIKREDHMILLLDKDTLRLQSSYL